MKLNRILRHLKKSVSDSFVITEEVDIHGVFKIVVNDFEELPIYISVTKTQILVFSNLCLLSEIKKEKKEEFLEFTNIMNLLMNLSSFSQNSTHYILFGALSVKSKLCVVEEEIIALFNNTKEALINIEDLLV